MNFNWQELHTRDFAASVTFYANSFDCNIRVVPGRNGKRYGLIIPENSVKPVAGIFETGTVTESESKSEPKQESDSAIESGWIGYVTVAKLRSSVETALANGAVELESFEIPYIGVVSILKDPAGQEINLIEYTSAGR